MDGPVKNTEMRQGRNTQEDCPTTNGGGKGRQEGYPTCSRYRVVFSSFFSAIVPY